MSLTSSSTMMDSATVKVTHGTDTRRFSIRRREQLANLKKSVQELFHIAAPFALKYIDADGDKITLAQQWDLDEALVGNPVLKVVVVPEGPVTGPSSAPAPQPVPFVASRAPGMMSKLEEVQKMLRTTLCRLPLDSVTRQTLAQMNLYDDAPASSSTAGSTNVPITTTPITTTTDVNKTNVPITTVTSDFNQTNVPVTTVSNRGLQNDAFSAVSWADSPLSIVAGSPIAINSPVVVVSFNIASEANSGNAQGVGNALFAGLGNGNGNSSGNGNGNGSFDGNSPSVASGNGNGNANGSLDGNSPTVSSGNGNGSGDGNANGNSPSIGSGNGNGSLDGTGNGNSPTVGSGNGNGSGDGNANGNSPTVSSGNGNGNANGSLDGNSPTVSSGNGNASGDGNANGNSSADITNILNQLAALGFHDSQHNLELLIKYKGDYFNTIQALLNERLRK